MSATSLVVVAQSKLLRLIFSLMPERLQRSLKRHLKQSTIALILRVLGATGPITYGRRCLEALMSRVQYPDLLHSSTYALVQHGASPVLARVDQCLSLEKVKGETLDIVSQALARHNIEYFHIRGYSRTNSVIVVPRSARRSVLAALRLAAATSPIYLYDAMGQLRPLKGYSSLTWWRLGAPDVVGVVRFTVDSTRSLVFGPESACEVEFWHEDNGMLTAPRPNRVSDVLPADGTTVMVAHSASLRERRNNVVGVREIMTRQEFLNDLIDDVTFPIDVVYTWVDGSDPAWRQKRDIALGMVGERLNTEAANESRYTSRDELRYSMRSIALFAPWVNHIWLVTDGQVPAWLDTTHKQVTLVSHSELFQGHVKRPTFNSHAIETQLHRIEGLSEHFLYFNDDVLLGRPVFPSTFFEANGLPKVALSSATVSAGPVSIDDTPATASGKNNRELIKTLGRHVTYKIKHCPHPIRRTTLEEVVERFASEVRSTASHQFRHPEDISLMSSLYQYYALATGRAIVGNPAYMYADVAHPTTPRRLHALLRTRDKDVVCLNDTNTNPDEAMRVDMMVSRFLRRYLPVAAPWEIDHTDVKTTGK